MCGITGVILFKGKDAMRQAVDLTIEQSHRGTTSTGIACINNNNIFILKDTLSPSDFRDRYSKLIESDNHDLVISHNRMPSQGRPCIENSHPFMSCDKQFALIHNGTEDTDAIREILVNLGHYFDGDTDSEVLLHYFEELTKHFSIIDSLKKLTQYFGRSSIVILTKSGEVYGYGHNIVIIRDKSGIYIASELDTFTNKFNNQRKEIYTLNSGTVFIIKNKQLSFEGEHTHECKIVKAWEPEEEPDEKDDDEEDNENKFTQSGLWALNKHDEDDD